MVGNKWRELILLLVFNEKSRLNDLPYFVKIFLKSLFFEKKSFQFFPLSYDLKNKIKKEKNILWQKLNHPNLYFAFQNARPFAQHIVQCVIKAPNRIKNNAISLWSNHVPIT